MENIWNEPISYFLNQITLSTFQHRRFVSQAAQIPGMGGFGTNCHLHTWEIHGGDNATHLALLPVRYVIAKSTVLL